MGSKSKSGGIFGGILAGIILIIIGVVLLWWNEGRTVKVQKGINEAKDVYTQIKSDKVDSKYDGKLVSTNGKLDLSDAEELVDQDFGIKVKSALMERNVEMYQWTETCETDDNDNEKCSYKKEWVDHLVDSSNFKESSKHSNPSSMPYESEEFVAENVKMGAFTLPKDLLEKLSTKKDKTNAELTEEAKEVEGYAIVNKYITNVEEDNPVIGNVRVSFSYNDADSVSVLAVQTGDSFAKYTTKSGTSVYRIKEGTHTGEEIIQDMTDENKTIKWLLRLVGLLLEIFGFASIFSPIKKLAGFIPFLGGLVSMATGLIALLLGSSVTLVVIAVAWLRFRPILSIVLLAIVGVLIFLLIKFKKKEPETSVTNEVTENN